jgi:lysophospholipase L1-like esterase
VGNYHSRVGFPKSASRAIREVAEATNTKLVEIAAAFVARCKDVECNELLIENDQHPQAEGHELVARTLLDALPPLFRQPASTAKESSR